MTHAKPFVSLLLAAAALATVNAHAEAAKTPADKPVHAEYKDWRIIGISHRLDKNSLRAILGNDIAINAVRNQKTSPWSDGSILTKVAWKESTHPNWPQAVIPGEFSGADVMVKNGKKYAATGGWGFGSWQSGKIEMFDEAKSATCFACHVGAKDRDYVYTFNILP